MTRPEVALLWRHFVPRMLRYVQPESAMTN